MHVRAIQAEELQAFISTATAPERVDAVQKYVHDLLTRGAMRAAWCYLAERDGRAVGRVAFWALPKQGKPNSLVLLDLDWRDEHAHAVGAALLQEMIRVARSLGVHELDCVLDSPAQWPQWQTHHEERAALLVQQGFTQLRETSRFELQAGEAMPSSLAERGLVFRSLIEVGEDAFKKVMTRVSEGSLDQRIRANQERLGPEGETDETFEVIRATEVDPAWCELGHTPEGEIVGLIMPTRVPSSAVIGYVGVVPEMRGRGYGEALLARGTATLLQAGATAIRADTDIHNTPMANAFRRAGYRQFATRREYGVRLSS